MNWYLVNSKPRQESVALRNLTNLGVEVYFPQLKTTKFIRRKFRPVTGPLFPGYLFVKFDLETQYRLVNYASGIKNVVTFGASVAKIEDTLIERIKERSNCGFVTIPSVSFSPGQLVRIQQGPLQGLDAVFESELSGRQRVIVLLRTIAFQARVEVPIEDVANL